MKNLQFNIIMYIWIYTKSNVIPLASQSRDLIAQLGSSLQDCFPVVI